MPPVTQNLIIANVVVFLLQNTGAENVIYQWFALWPPDNPFQVAFEPWQLLTYSFLHASIPHIFFNMFALYMFGSDIERLFGARFYVTYYFVCVLTAALFHLLVTSWLGAPPAPTVGASGGIYGLLLAFGMYFPNRQVMLLIPPIPMRARTFVIVFGLIEVLLGVFQSNSGVAHFAHLGGMLGGYLMIRYRRGWRR